MKKSITKSVFFQLYTEGYQKYIYEYTSSGKINKIEIIDVQTIFDKELAIKTKNQGILIFSNDKKSTKIGGSTFYLTPEAITNNISEGIKKKLINLSNRKEFLLSELKEVDYEIVSLSNTISFPHLLLEKEVEDYIVIRNEYHKKRSEEIQLLRSKHKKKTDAENNSIPEK